MKLILGIILTAIAIVECSVKSIDTDVNETCDTEDTSEDASLDFIGLANKYGKEVKAHEVITDDGYNLTLFNVPGNKSRPVLLVHGFLDVADAFILRGKTSLVLNLSLEGYDVWAANYRGNKYSRHHITLNPDTDKEFWDFSLHEIGYYDMAANIDYILRICGVTQLQVIGHSEGTTVFYVLGTTRPEYNDKIKTFISLAPICHLDHLEPPLDTLVLARDVSNHVLITLGMEEIFGNITLTKQVFNDLCGNVLLGYAICGEGVIQNIFYGSDIEEFEPEFYDVFKKHCPSGTSRKNFHHLTQLYKDGFRQYNYGSIKNLKRYGSLLPPSYDLTKLTMKTALLVGNNDNLSKKKDVETLKSQLPKGTVVEHRIIERKQMNHFDFTGGKHMYIYLFPHILEILEKYNY